MPSKRIFKQGLADPRTGPERIIGLVNKALASPTTKKQGRRYDDSPSKRARNVQETQKAQKARGVTTARPRKTARKK